MCPTTWATQCAIKSKLLTSKPHKNVPFFQPEKVRTPYLTKCGVRAKVWNNFSQAPLVTLTLTLFYQSWKSARGCWKMFVVFLLLQATPQPISEIKIWALTWPQGFPLLISQPALGGLACFLVNLSALSCRQMQAMQSNVTKLLLLWCLQVTLRFFSTLGSFVVL